MNKETIINEINTLLSANNIPFKNGESTDIRIDNELLNATWSTGKKTLEYKAYILLNQEEKIIYMWEMSKEKSAGFSFGSSSEKFSQSGATLFRKVSATGYGPEGKAYTYEFDLGQIPKIVKDVAKKYNWKFKIVLKKEKAMYS